MTQGELYKKIDALRSLKTTNITKKDTANIGPLDFSKKRFRRAIHPIALIEIENVLDEAKKEFYKIINEDVPEDQNDPESLYELMKYAVEKWFGGYEK